MNSSEDAKNEGRPPGNGGGAVAHIGSAARHAQLFPTLTPQAIDRIRRFGTLRHYADGDLLFETGQPSPGMLVVLSGCVSITQRDGLGHVAPVVEQGPGQFLAEIATLSGRPALVDGRAEGAVEALLISPENVRALMVAEAELGERIMRALILRRVALIESAAGGPIFIGPENSPKIVQLENFLTRNGFPHHRLDPRKDADAHRFIDRYAPTEDDLPLVVLPDGQILKNPGEAELARALRMVGERRPGIPYHVAVVVFAVGDVRFGSVKRVGGAIGEGAKVCVHLHEFIASNPLPQAAE